MEEDEIKQIIKEVEAATGISEQMMYSSVKSRTVSQARSIAMYILRQRGYSYPVIGKIMGGKNHATAILACRRVEDNKKSMEISQGILSPLPKIGEKIDFVKQIKERENAKKRTGYIGNGKWKYLFGIYAAECQVCGTEDIVEVHHIRAIKNGGGHTASNLLILCPNHHRMLHMGWLEINKLKPKRLITGS